MAQGAAKTTGDQRSGAEALHAVPVNFLKCDEEIPPVARYAGTGYSVQRLRGTAVPVPLSMKVIAKHEVWCFLSKVCSAKRHNVSFVGSGGFYSIFQHTDGNRPHSMACRGQHGSEFTEPEMIAKIIRIGTSRFFSSRDLIRLMCDDDP